MYGELMARQRLAALTTTPHNAHTLTRKTVHREKGSIGMHIELGTAKSHTGHVCGGIETAAFCTYSASPPPSLSHRKLALSLPTPLWPHPPLTCGPHATSVTALLCISTAARSMAPRSHTHTAPGLLSSCVARYRPSPLQQQRPGGRGGEGPP